MPAAKIAAPVMKFRSFQQNHEHDTEPYTEEQHGAEIIRRLPKNAFLLISCSSILDSIRANVGMMSRSALAAIECEACSNASA